MRTIPTSEPTVLVAGDTATWRRSLADFLASDGWALKYAFRGAGILNVTADADGDGYLVTVPKATTAGMADGLYEWTAYVEKGQEHFTVDAGRCLVTPDLSAAAAGVRQKHAERALPLIEAQIEQLLASSIESHSIEQTTIQRRKLDELYAIRNRYRNEVQRLQSRGRLPAVRIRFGRA